MGALVHYNKYCLDINCERKYNKNIKSSINSMGGKSGVASMRSSMDVGMCTTDTGVVIECNRDYCVNGMGGDWKEKIDLSSRKIQKEITGKKRYRNMIAYKDPIDPLDPIGACCSTLRDNTVCTDNMKASDCRQFGGTHRQGQMCSQISC